MAAPEVKGAVTEERALALPKAPRICLSCRTLLDTDRCEYAPKHRVASLATEKGRGALLDEVWGPPSRRRRARQLAKAGGAGGGAGGLDACGGCDVPGDPEAIIIVLAIALVAVAVYWVGSFLWRLIQRYRHRLKPAGALDERKLAPSSNVVGTGEVDGESFRAPASGEPCLAYGLQLESKGAVIKRVVLRHDHTEGFTVTLEGGDRLVVPPGRIRLWGDAERHRWPKDDVDVLVERLSRGFPSDEDDYPPFPYDAAVETRLERGARVEIRGDVDAQPIPDAKGPYRERAPQQLHPRGAVDVRIL